MFGFLLSLVGFSAIGPVAGKTTTSCIIANPSDFNTMLHLGTLAATWQATIGNVVAGSVFAGLQSFSMGGLGVLGLLGSIFGL
jgi:hypothetical protein